mgnify:CR=1 FL=1
MQSKLILVDFEMNNIDIGLSITNFPGGEINVITDPDKIEGLDDEVGYGIKAWIHDSDGLIALAQLSAILRSKGMTNLNLILGYVPYARQDRICNNGESLAIKVFTNFINSLNFTCVLIFDPHSDVTPALINSVCTFSKEEILARPIVIDHNGVIIDGNHRAVKAKQLGMQRIPAYYPIKDAE